MDKLALVLTRYEARELSEMLRLLQTYLRPTSKGNLIEVLAQRAEKLANEEKG